jgi:hypothetical protein
MEVAFSRAGTYDLIGNPTTAHLAVLYLLPLLAACWVLLTTVTPLRSPVVRSPDPDAT